MPDFTAEAALALTRYRSETLQYAPRLGLLDLREWICEFLAEEGIKASPAEIIVVNGAKHGLDLACKLFLNDGDCVAVTAPTYFTGIPIFRSHGLSFLQVPQDAEGISIDFLHREIKLRRRNGQPIPKMIYDIPDFHNPTGITMSPDRRRQLVAFANQFDVVIVEDSPYRKIRFGGPTFPPLKALDDSGRVVYLGTFAKLLAPGLRIGWVVSTAESVARIAQLKSDGGSCPLTQRIVFEYCSAGKLSQHLDRVSVEYHKHRDIMVAELREKLPQASFRVPDGGYYLWIGLPGIVDADRFAEAATAKGVEIISGTRFYADRNIAYPENRIPGSDHIRLAFSFASPTQIKDGIGRLAEIFHQPH
jgi:2-aminoadipate transaminase